MKIWWYHSKMFEIDATKAFLTAVIVLLVGWVVWLSKKHQRLQQLARKTQDQLTAAKQHQQQLDLKKNDAEAADRAKNRYLSGISHELRTPLNVIMGYAQLLENQAQEGDPHHEKYTLMRHNCEHLNHLIEGILEFSAIESGKLKVQSDWVDLHDMVKQLTLMFSHQADQKSLGFEVIKTEQLPQTVKTDLKRLQQILINLLSNAIKFTDEGGVTLNITYRNQVARFAIKDSGPGISEDDQERIFEPFERLQQHTVGIGLGLPITRLLVELMGGELEVNSSPGQGSEFVVRMMLPAQQGANTQPSDAPAFTHLNNQGEHQILVVDDQASHRQLLTAILAPHQFRLDTAQSGQEAQQLMKNHDFDLAIIDVSMPVMDGWELAAWIHHQQPDCRLLMLSANPRDQDQSHQIHHAYLTKPVKINQLNHQLNQLLDLGWQTTEVDIQQHKPAADEALSLNHEQRQALLNMADIGHINGIEDYLKKLYAEEHLSDQQWQQLSTPLKHMNFTAFKQMVSHD